MYLAANSPRGHSMKHNDCFGLACSHLLLLGGHHISSSFIQYALRSPCFCPSLCTASLFFLLFRLFFFCFSSLGSPATFFTRERVACLLSIYDCTTLVFDYHMSPEQLMPGWNSDSSRLTGDPPGRRVVCVLRRVLKAGSTKAYGSTFTIFLHIVLFVHLLVGFVSQKENDFRCTL